jgi:hypothetical protein
MWTERFIYTHLPQLQPIVNLVFERAHLDFSDELGLDMGIPDHGGKQFAKMREDDIHLIVNCRVQRGQCKAVVTQVSITKHVHKHRDDKRS